MEINKLLIQKSIEAFIVGIELYNKPTIKYRIEGFSFFICNAWELMLKARLVEEGVSIYYKDQPNRTLSLNDVIKKIYTDKTQPLRINLEQIIDLRNTSTHFATEEFETIYAPLFQANIQNYAEQIKRFHNVEVTDYIRPNFLALSINVNHISDNDIKAKYPAEMANKILLEKQNVNTLSQKYTSNAFHISIEHRFYLTKKKDEANAVIAIDSTSSTNATIIKEMKDPSNVYILSFSQVVEGVNKQLRAKMIEFNYVTNNGDNIFNTHTLNLFIQYYQIKQNKIYSYTFGGVYRYSQKLVEFIISEISTNKNVILLISKKLKKDKKKDNPRVIGMLSFRLLPFGNPELILHELSYIYYSFIIILRQFMPNTSNLKENFKCYIAIIIKIIMMTINKIGARSIIPQPFLI